MLFVADLSLCSRTINEYIFSLPLQNICLSVYLSIYLGGSADGEVKFGELYLPAAGLGSDLLT